MRGQAYDLLVEANESTLPLTLDDGGRIDQLRAYAAAGWVEASIPCLVPGPNGSLSQPPATLTAITSMGRKIAEQARASRSKFGRSLSGRARLLRG